MVTLETTVNIILDTLQSTEGGNNTTNRGWSSPVRQSTHNSIVEVTTPPLSVLIRDRPVSSQTKQSRRREIEALASTYLAFCASQPLPLFPKEGFVESIFERSDATLFAIIAASLRYIDSTGTSSQDRDAHAFREAAQSLAMEDIARGDVSTSTLQTLCLVVFFDFGSKSKFLQS